MPAESGTRCPCSQRCERIFRGGVDQRIGVNRSTRRIFTTKSVVASTTEYQNRNAIVREGWNFMAQGNGNRSPVVFLFDVDNTLLNNDRVSEDLRRHLTREVGAQRQERYWAIFEELRVQLGYADYLGALQRYRIEYPHDYHLLEVSTFMVNYPFANRLFPGSIDAIHHLSSFGPTVILSDGDVVFQPRKVERSGLYEEVEGRVLIYVHKEQELAEVERLYPATVCNDR